MGQKQRKKIGTPPKVQTCERHPDTKDGNLRGPSARSGTHDVEQRDNYSPTQLPRYSMPLTTHQSSLDNSSSTIILPPSKDRPVAITVTVREAGRALGVSRATIYRLIDDGDLPSYRIRNRTLLKVSDLEALVTRSRSKVVPVSHLDKSKRSR